MELGGLKTVPVMEAGWKGEERERERGEGRAQSSESSTHVAGPNLGHHCDRLARSSQTWVTVPPTQAAGRPRGCRGDPLPVGGLLRPGSRATSRRGRGAHSPRVGQGAPAQTLHFQNFWGPDLLSEARPGLNLNLREEGKPSRDRRSTYL